MSLLVKSAPKPCNSGKLVSRVVLLLSNSTADDTWSSNADTQSLNLKTHLAHDHILLQMQSPKLVIVPCAIQLASAGGQCNGILVITG